MNIKKILLFFIVLTIVFSFTACKNNVDDDTPELTSSTNVNESFYYKNSESTTKYSSTSDSVSLTEENFSISNVNQSDNPAEWSTDQIIDIYKNAARKTNSSVTSEQVITLKNISVNNGEYESIFEFITPIMSKLLSNNSTPKNGITGGFNNLNTADIASAKAYKSGNSLALEMVMNEQTAGANDDALSGSVGHAITAVGDISVVTQQLKDLGIPLDFSEKNINIYYTNPVVKVLINSNGEIVKGTWKYTVEIILKDYKAFGKPVNSTSVIMDNTITVNGGF